MIRKTLLTTKAATFIVNIPDIDNQGFARPRGTGFFISKTGYFITANHIVNSLYINETITLERPDDPAFVRVEGAKLVKQWPSFDLALLKAEFEENKQRDYFKIRKDFPYLEIDYQDQEEGSPVYAFGYPLMQSVVKNTGFIISTSTIPTRVTSAIISSNRENFAPIMTSSDPKFYVIDKALNYGNSGGPIVLTETGKAISVCVRFQPQKMKDTGQKVPSLYGITSSLQNIQEDLEMFLKQ